MARVKLSEFRAKKVLHDFLEIPYSGISFDCETENFSKIESKLGSDKKYVVKVDEGVKKRFKQGLVKLDVGLTGLKQAIEEFKSKGFRFFLIEELVPHEKNDEKYLAIERTREGNVVYYSEHGGIDIEEHRGTVQTQIFKDAEDAKEIASALGLEEEFFLKILEAFDIFYFSFFEINPLVISSGKVYFLDIACEADSAGEFFVDTWSSNDFRNSQLKSLTEEEKNIRMLSEKSSSSLTLNVLNPDGSIFMLLSGGGVSVALADEVANLGKGKILANYGEYSGNPTEEETYIYTKNLLSLLLKSGASNKVLIIGGGVANFTDVRITFKGVVRAIGEVRDEIKRQNVQIFVRRGGPHQDEGLTLMGNFLEENGIGGEVHGPELIVSEIVSRAINSMSS